MVPLASSSMSSGRFPGIITDESQWSYKAAQTNPQTTQSSPKSKFRSLSARRRRRTDTRVCTPTPILPLPQLLPSLSDARAVRAVLGQPDLGPRGEDGCADTPTVAEGLKEEQPAGSQPGPASSRESGAGGGSELRLPPPPQARASPYPPPQTQTDKRTDSRRPGGR